MYTLGQIRKGILNPELAMKVLYRDLHYLNNRINRSFREPIQMMQEDWDNLIILDACRFDYFKKENPFDTTADMVLSPGSSTKTFLRKTITETYPGVVYVTANSQTDKLNLQDSFHDHIRVWKENWDSDLKTVPPDVMADRTIEVAKSYPNKKIISHFIQPHEPHIGPIGKNLNHRGAMDADADSSKPIWDFVRDGELSKKELRQSYRENVQIVMPHICRLVDQLHGKTVITADHGECLGGWGIYGHPHNHFIEPLVFVPWLVIDSTERKNIKKEGINKSEPVTPSEVKSRLIDLGYI